MLDLAIGIVLIIVGLYGVKDYFTKKEQSKTPVYDLTSGIGISRIGFGGLLLIIIGIAFILRGFGLLNGDGF